MYDTATIAYITEQTQRTVQRHIEQGYLSAKIVSKKYYSSQKELNKYLIEYLYSDNRYEKKSKAKKSLKNEDVEFLEKFLHETKECNTIEDLILKFAKIDLKIPTIEMFERFKTHQNIIKDRKKGLNYVELVEKHNVSSATVHRVLKSAREIKS